MKVGVVSVQGAFPEHIKSFRQAMSNLGLEGEVVTVRRRKDIDGVDCLVLPGGESTAISKLLRRFELFETMREMVESGVPIMGTCAGCVLLAKEGGEEVNRTGTVLLGLMDMEVRRNAFGRQRESFETNLDIKGIDTPFQAVFIRGPVIERVWGDAEV
ncbi:MAG: pyridoxal 5'-phosphate synthase glutaminase subunit PdxT, partial [Methanomassiliicoccales archaeon]